MTTHMSCEQIAEMAARFELCCPVCGKILMLAPPKSKRPGLRIGPERTEVVCDRCGADFSYSGRLETHKKSSPTGKRRFCIYLKIPIIVSQRKVWATKLNAGWKQES